MGARRDYRNERRDAMNKRDEAIASAESIFRSGTYKGEMKPVDKYDPRYNYKTYKYDYYSGAQAKVFFGDIWVDDIITIQYTINQSKQPIYGYASSVFDAVAMGTVIGNGSLTIAFKETAYLNVIKNILDKQRDAGELAKNNATFRLGAGGESINSTNGSSSNIRGTSDYSAIVTPNATPSLLRKSETIENILDDAVISKFAFGDNQGRVKDFEDVVEAYEDSIWGDSNGKIGSNFYKILRADQFDNMFDKNSTPYGVYCAELDDYSNCLNIILSFGDMTDQRAEHTLIVLNDVHFTGQGMVISPDGQPLAETYEFFFRDFNQTLTRNSYLINEAKVNISPGESIKLAKMEDVEALITSNTADAILTIDLSSGFNTTTQIWEKINGTYQLNLTAKILGLDINYNDVMKFYEIVQDTFSYFAQQDGNINCDLYSKVLVKISSNKNFMIVPYVILDQIIPGGTIFKVNASNDFVALDLVKRSDFFNTDIKGDMEKKIAETIAAATVDIENLRPEVKGTTGDISQLEAQIAADTISKKENDAKIKSINTSLVGVDREIDSLNDQLKDKNITNEQKIVINNKLLELTNNRNALLTDRKTIEDNNHYLMSSMKLTDASLSIANARLDQLRDQESVFQDRLFSGSNALSSFIDYKVGFKADSTKANTTITNLSNGTNEIVDSAVSDRRFDFLSTQPQQTNPTNGYVISIADLDKKLATITVDTAVNLAVNWNANISALSGAKSYRSYTGTAEGKGDTFTDTKTGETVYGMSIDPASGKGKIHGQHTLINLPGGFTTFQVDHSNGTVTLLKTEAELNKAGVDFGNIKWYLNELKKDPSLTHIKASLNAFGITQKSIDSLQDQYLINSAKVAEKRLGTEKWNALPWATRVAIVDISYAGGLKEGTAFDVALDALEDVEVQYTDGKPSLNFTPTDKDRLLGQVAGSYTIARWNELIATGEAPGIKDRKDKLFTALTIIPWSTDYSYGSSVEATSGDLDKEPSGRRYIAPYTGDALIYNGDYVNSKPEDLNGDNAGWGEAPISGEGPIISRLPYAKESSTVGVEPSNNLSGGSQYINTDVINSGSETTAAFSNWLSGLLYGTYTPPHATPIDVVSGADKKSLVVSTGNTNDYITPKTDFTYNPPQFLPGTEPYTFSVSGINGDVGPTITAANSLIPNPYVKLPVVPDTSNINSSNNSNKTVDVVSGADVKVYRPFSFGDALSATGEALSGIASGATSLVGGAFSTVGNVAGSVVDGTVGAIQAAGGNVVALFRPATNKVDNTASKVDDTVKSQTIAEQLGLMPVPSGTTKIIDIYMTSGDVGDVRDANFNWLPTKQDLESKYPGAYIRINNTEMDFLNNISVNTPDSVDHLIVSHGNAKNDYINATAHGDDRLDFSAISTAIGKDKAMLLTCGTEGALALDPQPNLSALPGINAHASVVFEMNRFLNMTDSDLSGMTSVPTRGLNRTITPVPTPTTSSTTGTTPMPLTYEQKVEKATAEKPQIQTKLTKTVLSSQDNFNILINLANSLGVPVQGPFGDIEKTSGPQYFAATKLVYNNDGTGKGEENLSKVVTNLMNTNLTNITPVFMRNLTNGQLSEESARLFVKLYGSTGAKKMEAFGYNYVY